MLTVYELIWRKKIKKIFNWKQWYGEYLNLSDSH